MDVKLYLALAGSLGLAYVTYNMLNKPRIITISREQTQRISQEIKHQIMILCISYGKSMKKIREQNAEKLKGRIEELLASARNELSQLYVAKEQLILKKFSISRQIYGKSLEKWKHDKKLIKNTDQILNMMECAVDGRTPDLTIPQNVYQKFTREQVLEIYKQMVTLIGKKVAQRLRQQVDSNKDFDLKSDEHFRTAVRSLQIYDLKVNYLKQKGFSESWGCPNEIFFKYLESEKLKDQEYEKKAIAYEKCYEKVIEVVSLDPKKASDASIDEMFEKALNVPAPVAQVVPPVKAVPVEAPKPFVAPAKVQKQQAPVDEDAELEALMMQELMSRSQEPQKSVESDYNESRKMGLTESEVQNDWERYGSIHEKEITKMEEATEQIAINEAHEKDIAKALEEKFEEAVKVVEAEGEAPVQEPAQEETVVVEPPIVDVEPVVEQVVEPVVEVVIEPVAETVVVEVTETIETIIVVEEQKPEAEEQKPEVEEQKPEAKEQENVEAPVEQAKVQDPAVEVSQQVSQEVSQQVSEEAPVEENSQPQVVEEDQQQ